MKAIEFQLSKKMTILLATFAPALFGCLYYIFVHIPVMGDLWYIISPFVLLLYWGWIGGFYRDSEIKFLPSLGIAHLYAVVFFILYMLLYYESGVVQGDSFADQIVFWFTYPLQFVTVSLAVIINGAKVSDAMLVFYSQFYGLIIMIIAFAIGYARKHAVINKIKRKEQKMNEEARRIQDATNMFKRAENIEE